MRSLPAILFAAILLGGCSTGPDWKRQLYSFSMPADPPNSGTQSNIVALSRVAISPLFQSHSFTYRTAENSYEQDPYAGFLIPPERALAESIRAFMQAGAFGRVVEPGSGLRPNVVAEVFITELYGDFRKASQPVGKMEVHFMCYEVRDGMPGRVVLDKVCSRETPLNGKTPAALMVAWDADLGEIMGEINTEFAKTKPNER